MADRAGRLGGEDRCCREIPRRVEVGVVDLKKVEDAGKEAKIDQVNKSRSSGE